MTYEEAKEILSSDSCYECAWGEFSEASSYSAASCDGIYAGKKCEYKEAILIAIEALEEEVRTMKGELGPMCGECTDNCPIDRSESDG